MQTPLHVHIPLRPILSMLCFFYCVFGHFMFCWQWSSSNWEVVMLRVQTSLHIFRHWPQRLQDMVFHWSTLWPMIYYSLVYIYCVCECVISDLLYVYTYYVKLLHHILQIKIICLDSVINVLDIFNILLYIKKKFSLQYINVIVDWMLMKYV